MLSTDTYPKGPGRIIVMPTRAQLMALPRANRPLLDVVADDVSRRLYGCVSACAPTEKGESIKRHIAALIAELYEGSSYVS
jgi:hypothetical protein